MHRAAAGQQADHEAQHRAAADRPDRAARLFARVGMKPSSPLGGVRIFSSSSVRRAMNSTSDRPNSPIASGTRFTPSPSAMMPKVRRGVMFIGSAPMVPSSRPNAAISSARGQ
jgi:hypothetical protein